MSTDEPKPVENSELGLGLDESLIEHLSETMSPDDMLPPEEVRVAQERKNVSREFFLYSLMGSLVGLAIVLLVVDKLVDIPQKLGWIPGSIAVLLCLAAGISLFSAVQSNIRTIHMPITLLLFGVVVILCAQPIVSLVTHLRLEGLQEKTVEACVESTKGLLGQSKNGASWTIALLDNSDIREYRLDRQSDGTWSFVGEALPGCA